MSIANPTLQAIGRRLRLGVIGGSYGFIGPVHRTATRLGTRPAWPSASTRRAVEFTPC
jgi:hypothetical protein